MRGLRPIPVRLLPDTCAVRERAGDGTFGRPRVISHVRFERTQSWTDDTHRSADAGEGTLFVDAVTSTGAFEVQAGSRIDIDGHSYLAATVRRCEGTGGTVHHWEVGLR
jgi:hypothetical protein